MKNTMSEEEPIEKNRIQLSYFGPDEWFKDRSASSFWLRIYTSLYIPHKEFIPLLKNAITRLQLEKPVAISYALMEGLKVPFFKSYIYASEDGKTILEFNGDERELKKSNYILLSTPMKIDGTNGSEVDSKKILNIASSIISIHIGKNFIRDIVFEGEIEADKDKFHIPGPGIKMPQMPEGPFIDDLNWEQIEEITNKLNLLLPETKSRIELSLEYFNKALDEEDCFFYYWTSLEILCNGKSQKIREKLKSCYSFENLGQVDKQAGFLQISRWRHDFFHKGIRPKINADVERYIQLLYLDLLRQEIHLPLVGHIAGMQNAQGYDLTDIGLENKRHDSQKQTE